MHGPSHIGSQSRQNACISTEKERRSIFASSCRQPLHMAVCACHGCLLRPATLDKWRDIYGSAACMPATQTSYRACSYSSVFSSRNTQLTRSICVCVWERERDAVGEPQPRTHGRAPPADLSDYWPHLPAAAASQPASTVQPHQPSRCSQPSVCMIICRPGQQLP